MCKSCDEWKLGCVRVKDCLSYVDGQWCVGNLVCGGFSVSNYLQGNLGTGRHDHILDPGKFCRFLKHKLRKNAVKTAEESWEEARKNELQGVSSKVKQRFITYLSLWKRWNFAHGCI